jgi:N-acetylglucosamine-6-phosphate deacetylase
MAGAVRNMVALTSADVAMASRMASHTRPRSSGWMPRSASLSQGRRADMVWLDAALQPVQCWIGGTTMI